MAEKFEPVTLLRGEQPIFGIADWSDMGRKKPVLWIQTDECSRVKVASFNNDRAAEMFIDTLVLALRKGKNDKDEENGTQN